MLLLTTLLFLPRAESVIKRHTFPWYEYEVYSLSISIYSKVYLYMMKMYEDTGYLTSVIHFM